jgi:cytidylate kinase
MKITISGALGSGKSTVAKLLAKKLHLDHYSMGDFQRMLAEEKGMSILEFSEYVMNNPQIDRLTDEKLKKIGEQNADFVVDARLGWYFIPDSIKIFLHVDEEESARRIYAAKRGDETENKDLQKTIQNIKKRKAAEIERYKKLYNVNYYDPKHYDLLIDTTHISAQDVVDTIISFLKTTGHLTERLKKNPS